MPSQTGVTKTILSDVSGWPALGLFRRSQTTAMTMQVRIARNSNGSPNFHRPGPSAQRIDTQPVPQPRALCPALQKRAWFHACQPSPNISLLSTPQQYGPFAPTAFLPNSSRFFRAPASPTIRVVPSIPEQAEDVSRSEIVLSHNNRPNCERPPALLLSAGLSKPGSESTNDLPCKGPRQFLGPPGYAPRPDLGALPP